MNEHHYIEISFYTQPIIILFGTIGALLNQILFRQRKLFRQASCSLYFRALSINDLLVLYLIVFTQWFHDQYHLDLTMKYIWYCKLRTYATYCLYAISPYLLTLACFDRLCRASRNIHLRQVTTPTVARHLIKSIIILIMFVYGHILFQYDIIHSNCLPLSRTYFQFLGYFLLIFYCLLPPILMSVLCTCTCFLLYRRRQKQQIQYRLRIYSLPRHRDYQLIKILLLYVTTNIICTFPFAVVFLLNVYTFNSNPQLLILLKLTILLANVNYCSSFYVYTLGTPLYRRELLCFARACKNRLMML